MSEPLDISLLFLRNSTHHFYKYFLASTAPWPSLTSCEDGLSRRGKASAITQPNTIALLMKIFVSIPMHINYSHPLLKGSNPKATVPRIVIILTLSPCGSSLSVNLLTSKLFFLHSPNTPKPRVE